jgi:hypothetical protein
MVTIATGAEPVSRLLRTCGDANVSRDLIMFYAQRGRDQPRVHYVRLRVLFHPLGTLFNAQCRDPVGDENFILGVGGLSFFNFPAAASSAK